VILRLAHAGEVLGLNEVLRDSTYDATVKTLEPCRVDFISRAGLMELVESNQAGTHLLLKSLSNELTKLTARTRSLLLPQTASAKLAKLLLECSNETLRIDRVFTHEQIAQMICSSRETVTRLLTNLSRRNIVRITSESILICDGEALETMALAE
jgi:CRP/FNR family transcriptional regulator